MKTQTETIYPIDYTIEHLYYYLAPREPDGYTEKEANAYNKGAFDMLEILYGMDCLDWLAEDEDFIDYLKKIKADEEKDEFGMLKPHFNSDYQKNGGKEHEI